MRMLPIVALLLAVATSWQSQAQTLAGAQDGLVADMALEEGTATVRWQFDHALPSKMEKVSAEFNGRPVKVRSVKAYPGTDDLTLVLAIVDVAGGAARKAEIDDRKTIAAAIMAAVEPHHRVGLFSAVGGLSSASGPNGADVAPVDALVAFGEAEQPADLGKSLGLAIEAAVATGFSRKGIFLFTDGQSAPAPDFAKLGEAASKGGVKIYVYFTRGGDAANGAGFKQLAEVSGGGFYEGDGINRALAQPYAFLDSGATANIPLTGVRRYFWDEDNLLRASFKYGDKALVLETPISVPDADLSETISYVWDYHGRTVGFVLAGVGWALALLVMPFARWPGQRKPMKLKPMEAAVAAANSAKAAAAASVTLAAPVAILRLRLSETASGYSAQFDLDAPRITIGRARDNTVVIANDTVSGHQAVLIRGDDGRYGLTNLSETNPTTVNGAAVQFQTLNNADELGLGSVSGRFEQAAR